VTAPEGAGEPLPTPHRAPRGPAALAPGLLLVCAIAAAAWFAADALGGRWRLTPDAVVLGMLAGLGVRAFWHPPRSFQPGIDLAGRELLELAIVLLGTTVDMRWFLRGGPMVLAVVATTLSALGIGMAIGRAAGLTRTHALLVASGNAICGNSAIAAIARVTRAPAREVTSSIACTALLSLPLVLALPLGGALLGLNDEGMGMLAGMTVYAVPQVLAATLPMSARAGEVGALVKLVRVLLLAPWLAWVSRREHRAGDARRSAGSTILPRYLVAFLLLAALRTATLIPDAVALPAQRTSHLLTGVAMAALGLAVEPASLRQVGRATLVSALGALVVLCVLAATVVLAVS
jgi:uncharacterized integral membrane protein (TIGR00698 family)